MKVLWSICGAINRLAMAIEANTRLGYTQIQILREIESTDDEEEEIDFDNWLRGPDGRVKKQ